jgi:proton-coupled amino acid transporter
LAVAFSVITALYLSFGFTGYFAYGEETKDIISLNLPNDWTTIAVKAGLSIGLFFTFPVMLYPVHEIFERKMLMNHWFQEYCSHPVVDLSLRNGLRGIIVLAIAIVAAKVPGFGLFISFVGSTVCAMLAFVIPALLHIKVCRQSSNMLSKGIDLALIGSGFLFAIYGTYTTALDIFGSNQGELPGS